jgi:hypothetical protein
MKLPQPLKPGTRVRIRRLIRHGRDCRPCEVEGVVLEHLAETTGSWFAHLPKDKLWLNRIRLKKDDGEISVINLDRDSKVTVLASSPRT